MKLIVNIGKAVTGVLALAGGFLKDVVPPVTYAQYVAGFSQLLTIIIVFYALQNRNNEQLRRVQSMAAIVFIMAGVGFYLLYSFFVYEGAEGLVVVGYQATQDLYDACRGEVNQACIQSHLQTPGISLTFFWTRWSILLSEIVMMLVYVAILSAFVLFAYASIDRFGLAEPPRYDGKKRKGITRVMRRRKIA